MNFILKFQVLLKNLKLRKKEIRIFKLIKNVDGKIKSMLEENNLKNFTFFLLTVYLTLIIGEVTK